MYKGAIKSEIILEMYIFQAATDLFTRRARGCVCDRIYSKGEILLPGRLTKISEHDE